MTRTSEIIRKINVYEASLVSLRAELAAPASVDWIDTKPVTQSSIDATEFAIKQLRAQLPKTRKPVTHAVQETENTEMYEYAAQAPWNHEREE